MCVPCTRSDTRGSEDPVSALLKFQQNQTNGTTTMQTIKTNGITMNRFMSILLSVLRSVRTSHLETVQNQRKTDKSAFRASSETQLRSIYMAAFVPACMIVWRALSKLAPSGAPKPVHASYPDPAE